MTLLQEIQSAAIDMAVPVETLLRKCRVLASRLQHEELKVWVQHELDGYYGDVPLPRYRVFHGNCFGHFSGPFGSGLRNAPIPEACIPEDIREQLTTVELRQGVAALTGLERGAGEENLHVAWPANAALLFGTKIYQRMNLMQAWIAVPPSTITDVLSTIRNRVLNFALEIEAKNPAAGEATTGAAPLPRESVSQIFNNYIFGNVGSVASGSSIQQSATLNISAGDFGALERLLIENGVSRPDIEELHQSIKMDPKPESAEKFGPKVSAWIGKMLGNAAGGTWKVTTTVAANLLSGAIKAYYDLP